MLVKVWRMGPAAIPTVQVQYSALPYVDEEPDVMPTSKDIAD